MKKRFAFLVICMLLVCFSSSTILAQDNENPDWNMWHGNQDALILGDIQEVEGSAFTIKVAKKLTPKGIVGDTYRQIPEAEIPETIIIENLGTYEISYHSKSVPEVGDCIIVSADKNSETWKCNWDPIEVSGLDYQTLEITQEDTPESVAWSTFIRTDGKMNDFSFSDENGTVTVIGKGVFDDGKVVEDIIYESQSRNFEMDADIVQTSKTPNSILIFALVATVIGTVILLVYLYKRKSE